MACSFLTFKLKINLLRRNFLLTKDSSFHKAANKIAVLDNVQVEKIAKFAVFFKNISQYYQGDHMIKDDKTGVRKSCEKLATHN